MDISELLLFTKQSGGSDLHLSAGVPPMVRVHGQMSKVNAPPLSAEEVHDMVYDILNDDQRKTFEEHRELDFSFSVQDQARFRGNVFLQNRGLGAVFRVIPTEVPGFEDLGLPEVLLEVCRAERGIVLVTGPTGSGKSTTLAAMINFINRKRRGHILTIEDPIEFVHQTINCMVNQREVGPHTHSFANSLKSALREDPDYILVGEMRDLETIALALTAAETGHLVFGTLHTSSAPKTIDRIIDVFPAGQKDQVRAMLAGSLEAVVAQTLLPKKGGKGRVAAHEIMLGTPAIRNLIREGKTHQIPSAIQAGRGLGMQAMEQSLKDLVMTGKVAVNAVLPFTSNPEAFKELEPGPPPLNGGAPAAVAAVGAASSAPPPPPKSVYNQISSLIGRKS